MIKFKVETGIPIPPQKRLGKNYPFDKMNVGDSFYTELTGDQEVLTLRQTLHSAALYFTNKNKNGQKWQTKPEANGVRIWRVK